MVTLMNPETRLITIKHISLSKYKDLRSIYGQELSCPCSNISISYNSFVSNTLSFDPVCTSTFVSRQWIEALYLPNASSYVRDDFRAIASSQVSERMYFHCSEKQNCNLDTVNT